jgi:NAD(P)-dependent dehydrogenase (short-subunit alcohol dehydrogenase family)
VADGYSIDLSSRTALVTGGSRGIGRACADLLARAGARVALNYVRNEAAANAAVREIRAAGGEAMALAGDVSKPEDARQLVRDVVAAWQRLDIVVNNAGVWLEDPAGEGRLDVWDRT